MVAHFNANNNLSLHMSVSQNMFVYSCVHVFVPRSMCLSMCPCVCPCVYLANLCLPMNDALCYVMSPLKLLGIPKKQ